MPKLILCLLFVPLLLKAKFVDDFIFEYTSTRWLGFSQVITNDALFYGCLLLLLHCSCLVPLTRFPSAMLRLLALTGWLIYIADYVIIVNFNTHLTWGDTVKYAGYSLDYLQQIFGVSPALLILAALVVLVLLLLFVGHPYRLPARYRRPLPLSVCVVVPMLTGFSDHNQYAHSWIYNNVIDYNLTILSEAAPYSERFINTTSDKADEQCEQTTGRAKNIVLVMVESLSAYQSQFFSGLQNWTPNLDRIASQNLAFKDFYANGFITEDGEVALLTGLPPIYPPSSYSDHGGTSFYSFFNLEHSLPRILHTYGYRSEFLTTADLVFSNTGGWAKSLGFDYVEGHDHPDYARWQRFHFKSAPDEALYLRALDRLKQPGQPYFVFMKTVSSHHPFVNPENKQPSEEGVIRYVDKQLGQFYQQLQASHFFDNGLLIIVGDHHSMTPLKNGEVERFGQLQASAKVPLIIIDGQSRGSITQPFQQIDVFNSLVGLVSGKQCHSSWRGNFFTAQPYAPQYILHRRGDNRDLVSVFSGTEAYQVKLAGDQTRVISQQVASAAQRQQLVDKINALRIARMRWANTAGSGE